MLKITVCPSCGSGKLKKVRNVSGGKRVTLMDRVDLEKELGLIVGAIAPLCFPKGTSFYIDPTVLEEAYVDISSGNPLAGIELKSSELIELIDGKVFDIISHK